MKKIAFILPMVFASLVSATETNEISVLSNYGENVLSMADFKGQTYLSFMQKIVKPAIDKVATEGYKACDGKVIEATYEYADKKVKGVVNKNGGLEAVKEIVEKMDGQVLNLNTSPLAIADAAKSLGLKVDRYALSTFIGLACGGGVVVKHYDGNYSYNVHYDTKEQRSGRSFGASPARGANDASDKAYLLDIAEYSREIATQNLPQFYQALLESLLNNDPQNYKNVVPAGQNVLTDFLAVYTAEQARNLMDGKVHIHWDAALLEVTLMAAFHAGQKEFKLYYMDPQTQKTSFTNTVYNQTPCAVPERKRAANMHDYWQFSRRISDAKNCRRSGINITNREFRKLGQDITVYMAKNFPELSNKLMKSMNVTGKSKNSIFLALSEFLINDKTPKKLGARSTEIARNWVAYLSQVTQSAEEITAEIEENLKDR